MVFAEVLCWAKFGDRSQFMVLDSSGRPQTLRMLPPKLVFGVSIWHITRLSRAVVAGKGSLRNVLKLIIKDKVERNSSAVRRKLLEYRYGGIR